MIDLEFIQRCNDFVKPIYEEVTKETKEKHRLRCEAYNNKNREYVRMLNRKYYSTERGKEAAKRGMQNRRKRHKEEFDKLGDYDKHLIRQFYNNRPKGMTVDHVVPLARGGRHHISNLQYLSPDENFRKACKLDWKPKETLTPPFGAIDIIEANCGQLGNRLPPRTHFFGLMSL